MNRRSSLEFSPGAAGPLIAADDDPSWQDAALCAQVDPELFYPKKGGSTFEARELCRTCPVRAECLTFALEHGGDAEPGQHGIWGGTSPGERQALLRSGADVPAIVARVTGAGNCQQQRLAEAA